MKTIATTFSILIFVLFVTLVSAADKPSATADGVYVKYLSIVYPTAAATFKTKPDGWAQTYYNHLVYYYRVPLAENNYTGVFNSDFQPLSGDFLFPDTVAFGDTSSVATTDSGFVTDDIISGSNKNYIEISTFGWLQYPYGAYYNWSPGSGVYVSTDGNTIAGHTRVDVLYKIYAAQHDLDSFYKELSIQSMVQHQIYGDRQADVGTLKTRICGATTDPGLLRQTIRGKDEYTLLGGLFFNDNWPVTKANLCKNTSGEALYMDLVEHYYVSDHLDANAFIHFNDRMPGYVRYAYLIAEASPYLDLWIYTEAKQAGYKIVQFTRAPNSSRRTSFELFDTRWPVVHADSTATDSISGYQNYSLQYAWNKAAASGYYSIRNPLDVNNDSEAIPLTKLAIPAMTTNHCASSCQIHLTPSDFDKLWLPPSGWNVQQCISGGPQQQGLGCSVADSFSAWDVKYPCPAPLVLKNGSQCHLVHYALDSSAQNGFSVADINYNIQRFSRGTN